MAEIIIHVAIPTRSLYFLNTKEKLKRQLQKKLKPFKITKIE